MKFRAILASICVCVLSASVASGAVLKLADFESGNNGFDNPQGGSSSALGAPNGPALPGSQSLQITTGHGWGQDNLKNVNYQNARLAMAQTGGYLKFDLGVPPNASQPDWPESDANGDSYGLVGFILNGQATDGSPPPFFSSLGEKELPDAFGAGGIVTFTLPLASVQADLLSNEPYYGGFGWDYLELLPYHNSGNHGTGTEFTYYIDNIQIIPEPATIMLSVIGLFGLGMVVRRRR